MEHAAPETLDLPLASPPRRVYDASGNVAALPRRQASVWLHAYPEDAGLAPLNLMAAGGILVCDRVQAGEGQPTNAQVIGPHLPLLVPAKQIKAGPPPQIPSPPANSSTTSSGSRLFSSA